MPFAQFTPVPRIKVDHFRHYCHFVSGQHCAGGRGGMFYLGLGYSKIRQKRSNVSSVLQPIVDRNYSLLHFHCIYLSPWRRVPDVKLCPLWCYFFFFVEELGMMSIYRDSRVPLLSFLLCCILLFCSSYQWYSFYHICSRAIPICPHVSCTDVTWSAGSAHKEDKSREQRIDAGFRPIVPDFIFNILTELYDGVVLPFLLQIPLLVGRCSQG